MLDYAINRSIEETKRRFADMQREGAILILDSLKKDLEDRKARQGLDLEAAVANVRASVTKAAMTLKESLAGAAEENSVRVRTALARYIGKLFLTSSVRGGQPAYFVSGGMTVEPFDEGCRMQLVARDGIALYATLFRMPVGDQYLDPRGARAASRSAA
jgi:hypothetical protein